MGGQHPFLADLIVGTFKLNSLSGNCFGKLPFIDVFVCVDCQYNFLIIESILLYKGEQVFVEEFNRMRIVHAFYLAKVPPLLLTHCETFCGLVLAGGAAYLNWPISCDESRSLKTAV